MPHTLESPDIANFLRLLRTFSRVSRARRLLTRRTIADAHIWDLFKKIEPLIRRGKKLARDGILEMLFEETKITDAYHDIILEEDFSMESRVSASSIRPECSSQPAELRFERSQRFYGDRIASPRRQTRTLDRTPAATSTELVEALPGQPPPTGSR